MYDLRNATVKEAAAFKPNESVNKSRTNPKIKLIIKNVILSILIGNVKIKTRHIYGSYIPNKLKLLNMNT